MRTVIGVIGLCAVCGLAYGQNAASAPALTFEVASVKPAPPADGRGRTVRATGIPGVPFMKDPGRFTAENFSLANLITLAYDIPHYRLSAAEDLNLLMFNIIAKMPVDTTKDQFKAMLQDLLAERFGLKVHWEERQMETYELVLAKSGPKLKDAVADAPSDVADAPPRPAVAPVPPARGPDGFPIPPPGIGSWMAIMSGKAAMRGHNETAAEMASKFSNQVGHPVTDGTGLRGKYDYTLYWSVPATRGMPAPAPPSADGSIRPGDDGGGPSLFSAIQEQLGLRLQPKKGEVHVLVVDRVEKMPTAN
ncbi:MAG TPA: TIGR03435 family protein [Bryobacteraceae bacterium]|nr:TIGR03435 family protein [Bryobacteraceae bacterium]